jgi:aspartate-semialdehyde dehydrogenase
MKTIAILGAHRAVAKALVELIDERELPLEVLRATTTDHLEADLELIDANVVSRAELFVACMGGTLIEALVAKTDRPVLDLAGVSEGPRLFPGIDPNAGAGLRGASRIPVGLAVPLVSALQPLAAFGLERAVITTLESAATRDREGMDELSDHVRALFNMRDVEPKAFTATLAFNVIPDELDDEELREEIADGLARSGSSPELRIARTLVPTFSADSAVVDVLVEDAAPPLDVVTDAFRGARGLTVAEELQAVGALGRDDALIGRVEVGPRRIAFYLAADRLRRGSATLACLALERWISK